MDEQLQARRALELDLRRAVQAGEFELVYQPLYHLGDERVTGCEALLRWRHPDLGAIQKLLQDLVIESQWRLGKRLRSKNHHA